MTADLHFHLGPAGAFIAEGRRTRDIWAGSFLLSWLVGEALAAARHRAGAQRDNIVSPLVQIKATPGATQSVDQWVPQFLAGREFLLDPTLAAIEARRRDEVPVDLPFFGTLPNHFVARYDGPEAAAEAGKDSARALRGAWKRLADAVRARILDDFAYAPIHAQRARQIWDQQVGDSDASPFWEIYWIVEGNAQGAVNLSPLTARKLTRISADAVAPLPTSGNFCTMFGAFVDVSGLERRTKGGTHERFWELTRAQLNFVRYRRRDLDSNHCLDLRPNESLCAPALVKRLFPLFLANHTENNLNGELTKAIGWTPRLRNAMPIDLQDPTFAQRVGGELTGEQPALVDAETAVQVQGLDEQSALLWPSVSYIAATHWIAKAQISQQRRCRIFAEALGQFAHQLAVAENSLWLRAVHESGKAPLGGVDGSMLHINRLERVKGGDKKAHYAALVALTALQQSPVDPTVPEQNLGAPSDYYAIIRADGDHIGTWLSKVDDAGKAKISQVFLRFAEKARGEKEGATLDERLGFVARRNGVLLFAGADEMLVLAPCEDAFAIALDIATAFLSTKDELAVEEPEASDLRRLTISASVLYCHIRAPLRWALDASLELLDTVAKDAAGRSALALGAFDIGGPRSRWASRWGSPQLAAMQSLIERASTDAPWLWSNVFYHRLSDTLRPFRAEPDYADYVDLVGSIDDEVWRVEDSVTIRMLAIHAAREQSRQNDPVLEEAIVAATTPHYAPRKSDGERVIDDLQSRDRGVVTLAPIDLLRLLGQNWRKSRPQVVSDEGRPRA